MVVVSFLFLFRRTTRAGLNLESHGRYRRLRLCGRWFEGARGADRERMGFVKATGCAEGRELCGAMAEGTLIRPW